MQRANRPNYKKKLPVNQGPEEDLTGRG